MSSSRSGSDVAAFGTRHPRLGTVDDFDADRGLGSVVTAGGVSFAFHSTAISGGSRQISVGTSVVFLVAPAPGGAFDAVEVTPIDREVSAPEDQPRSPGPAPAPH